MNLIFIAALVAVCGAAKLDRTYLPPASAKSAGGSPGFLQTPFAGNSVNDGLPKGSFTNDFQGVVVDAAAAGTRASGEGETGLGAPRITYGSTDSRVGEAAFRGTASFRPFPSGQNFDAHGQNFEQESQNFDGQSDQGFNRQNGQSFDRQAQVAEAEDNQTPNAGDQSLGQDVNQLTQQANGQVPAQGIQAERGASRFESKPERAQSAFERTASILRYENEVGPESYHYAFETDNGISAEENGVATNGVQAQGGFSYTGDDGQVYSVTYTADEGGYRPSGDHLPTPPPIPEEILKALAKNAKDEAAGLVDDGSYDAERYNAGSDYAESDSANVEHNDRQTPKFENRPADVSASGSFINQNNRPSEANSNEQPNLENGSSDSQDVINNNFGPAKGNTFLQSNRNKPSGAIGSSNNFGQAAQPESAPSSIGTGSRKEYLPPVNSFNHNGRPQRPSANAGQHNFGFNGATQTTAFASVGQAHNNFGSQPNSAIRRPDSEQAEVSAQGQSTGKLPESAFNNDINRFSQPVPSGQSSSQVFGSRNEYLPPKSHNDRRQGVRPQRPLDGASRFKNSQPESFGNVQSNDGFSQSSSSSTFNTGLNAQPTQSSFKQQQRPQQFNQVPHQTTQMQQNQNRGSSDRREENKNEQVNAFSSINQVPTSQPSTELTTPFESEEKPQSIAGSSATFSGFAPQSNSRPGVQRLSQSNGQSFRQQPLALKPQAPAFGSQVPAQYSQSTYSNNQQIQQNRFSQNQPEDVQLSPSTERPSFSQPQVSDQSYYYRQPAKPFNTPSGSRLPGAPSGQFNKINQKSPQSNGQLSGLPQQNIPVNPFESQKEFNRGSTRYPIAPTLGPVAPTGASDGQFLASTASSQYNGITQASISPFQPQSQGSTKYPRPPTLPVASPTLASQFNGITQATASSFAASPSRPAFQQTSFNQPQHSSLSGKPIAQQSESQDKEVPIQQYNGEIYEYNKPPQGLPSPAQKEQSAVPQRGQSFDSERQPSRTQFASNQPLSQDMSAQPPLSSFGANSQMASQPSRNQYAPIPSFESQRTSGQGLKPQSRPFTQPQGTRPSFGNQGSPNKCCESLDSKLESLRGASQADGAAPAQGQFTSPVNSQNSNRVSAQAQFGNQFSAPVSQPVSQGFAGRGESFGGPRKPPSFDQETGYHY